MRIVFAGSPDAALPTLRYLLDSSHEVVGVLSRPDAPKGRGRKPHPSAVSQFAVEHDLPLYQPKSLKNNPDAEAMIREMAPDLGVVVAYGAILPQNILDLPTHGWINIHFSLLPRWRGAAPVQRALETGDKETGITVFQLDLALDTGPVYATLPVAIPNEASAGELLTVLGNLAEVPLETALTKITSGTPPTPQTEDGVTYAPQLTASEGQIDWTKDATLIDGHIKGFTPSPGAWTLLGDLRLKVGVLAQNPEVTMPLQTLSPGEIFLTRHEVWVGTGTHPVCLDTVAPAGKKHMTADAWARGARLEAGMTFSSPKQGAAS